jgi:hypothetical protein
LRSGCFYDPIKNQQIKAKYLNSRDFRAAMNKKTMIISVSIGCVLLILGCAGNNKKEIQKKLMRMSDRELTHHHEMIEMRLIDIDRSRDQSISQRQDIEKRFYPGDHQNHMGHLHIGDNWNALRKEKTLTEIEMRKRSLSPP